MGGKECTKPTNMASDLFPALQLVNWLPPSSWVSKTLPLLLQIVSFDHDPNIFHPGLNTTQDNGSFLVLGFAMGGCSIRSYCILICKKTNDKGIKPTHCRNNSRMFQLRRNRSKMRSPAMQYCRINFSVVEKSCKIPQHGGIHTTQIFDFSFMVTTAGYIQSGYFKNLFFILKAVSTNVKRSCL